MQVHNYVSGTAEMERTAKSPEMHLTGLALAAQAVAWVESR